MPRLIDKRCVIKHLKELLKNSIMPTEWHEGVKSAITLLQKEPTVDAEPVKHGHWVDMGDFESCSVCNGTHLKEYQTYYGKCLWVKMDYCPHCGAKMHIGDAKK